MLVGHGRICVSGLPRTVLDSSVGEKQTRDLSDFEFRALTFTPPNHIVIVIFSCRFGDVVSRDYD